MGTLCMLVVSVFRFWCIDRWGIEGGEVDACKYDDAKSCCRSIQNAFSKKCIYTHIHEILNFLWPSCVQSVSGFRSRYAVYMNAGVKRTKEKGRQSEYLRRRYFPREGQSKVCSTENCQNRALNHHNEVQPWGYEVGDVILDHHERGSYMASQMKMARSMTAKINPKNPIIDTNTKRPVFDHASVSSWSLQALHYRALHKRERE